MRVIVAGTGRLGVAVIEPLIHSDHDVVALLLNGRASQGFRRSVYVFEGRLLPQRESPVALAAAHRIPLLWLDRMNDTDLLAIRALEPDLIITCGFSIILKRPILDLPKVGCINVHSSLLPRHRGPTPLTHAILAGDATAGVTVHATDEGIDTGAILDQAEFALDPAEDALTAYRKAADLTRERILDVVDAIAHEGIRGTPQPPGGSYEKKLDTHGLHIDWNQPAERIARLLRAVHPFQHAWFYYRTRPIRVLRGSATAADPSGQPAGTVLRNRPYVHVATVDGVFIVKTAYAYSPVPWLWPSVVNRPRVGEVLL